MRGVDAVLGRASRRQRIARRRGSAEGPWGRMDGNGEGATVRVQPAGSAAEPEKKTRGGSARHGRRATGVPRRDVKIQRRTRDVEPSTGSGGFAVERGAQQPPDERATRQETSGKENSWWFRSILRPSSCDRFHTDFYILVYAPKHGIGFHIAHRLDRSVGSSRFLLLAS